MGRTSSARLILQVLLITLTVVFALWLLYLLRKPISWIVVATFLAVALSGPVNFFSRRMRRGPAIAVTYLLLLLIPIGIGAAIVPPIVREATDLVEKVPDYARDVRDFVNENERLRKIDDDYDITQKLQEEANKLPNRVGDAAGALADVGVGIVNSIFAAVTIIILSIFLVANGRGWIHRLLALQPRERAVRLERALDDMGRAVGNYVAGAVVQAVFAGVTSFIVLTILGVPFALPLSVLVALFDLIPLVGATIAAVIVGIVTLFGDFPIDTIIWTIWAIVYQQLENTVIQPQIQRRAVSVHPFGVLVAVLFGSTLFGVPGALLAIPIAASVQIALREWWAYRRELGASARAVTSTAGAD
jgi:predicted PurR-regulated permease PerM